MARAEEARAAEARAAEARAARAAAEVDGERADGAGGACADGGRAVPLAELRLHFHGLAETVGRRVAANQHIVARRRLRPEGVWRLRGGVEEVVARALARQRAREQREGQWLAAGWQPILLCQQAGGAHLKQHREMLEAPDEAPQQLPGTPPAPSGLHATSWTSLRSPTKRRR